MRTYRTIEQEAERLHMSKTKIYSLVKTGKIPARRLGGVRAALLFDPEEVDEAIDKARTQPWPVLGTDKRDIPAPPAAPAENAQGA